VELHITLVSPLWWLTVLVASVAIAWTSNRLLCRGPVNVADSERALLLLARATRLRGWMAVCLCGANLAMLVVLGVANLRIPSLVGPVGLVFLLLCVSTLLLPWHLHLSSSLLQRRMKEAESEKLADRHQP